MHTNLERHWRELRTQIAGLQSDCPGIELLAMNIAASPQRQARASKLTPAVLSEREGEGGSTAAS
jgi:hypothetical protein